MKLFGYKFKKGMQSSLRVLIGALVCFFANIELSKGQSLSNKFTLPQKGLSLDLKWKGEFGHEYLLEVSQNPDFPGNETQKFKVTGYRYTLRLKSEGSFYWKVSLFDKTRSPASDENFPDKKVRNFFVQKPKKLSHPKGIWIGRWIMNPRLPKVVRWEKDPRAVNYRLEVFNFDGTEKLFSTKSFQNSYTFEDFVSHDEGYYLVRVASVDRYGWQGEFSKCRYTYVGNPRRKKAAPKVNLDLACLDRNPAANPKLTTQIEGHKTIGRNKLYSNSQVQIEGASFLVGSIADSDAEDQELASAMVTSLRGMYWLNHRHGFEGIFKTKLVGYNEQGNNLSPTNLEARYHMRWTGPSFWKSLFREFQFSAFAGYEVYKNSVKNGSSSLTPQGPCKDRQSKRPKPRCTKLWNS